MLFEFMKRCNKIMFRRKRSWLFCKMWPVTHYFVTNFFVTLWYLFFKLLNRTVIVGKKNIPHRGNTLLLSNHQSMVDSFLVGTFAFYPQSLFRPFLLPWNPAAEENFYKNPIVSWFADNWKCIPIKKGRKDVGALFRMAEALKGSPMVLFPEGTRSRDGSIGRPRGGAGLLILESKPTVIPVCISGMDKVLPIGSIIPRIFKRIYVYYGKPVDLSEFYGEEKSKTVARAIMNKVMDTIRAMRMEIEELSAHKNITLEKEFLDRKNAKGLIHPSK